MNPLVNAMNSGMTSAGGNNGLANIMRLLKSGNPEQIAQQMMQQNPKFREFMEANKGKSPEQVAQEHGLNLNEIMGRLK